MNNVSPRLSSRRTVIKAETLPPPQDNKFTAFIHEPPVRAPQSARGDRSPRPDLVLAQMRNSGKINAKLDESYFPEEIMAVHNYGYNQAHAQRVSLAQKQFDKQWNVEERLRLRSPRQLRDPLGPPRGRRDKHVLEKVLHEREELKIYRNSESARKHVTVERIERPDLLKLSRRSGKVLARKLPWYCYFGV